MIGDQSGLCSLSKGKVSNMTRQRVISKCYSDKSTIIKGIYFDRMWDKSVKGCLPRKALY